MFKNKKEYLQMRNAAMEAAERFMNDGNVEEANARITEVEELDDAWEEFEKMQANFNALNMGASMTGIGLLENNVKVNGVSVGNFAANDTANDKQDVGCDAYKNAWIHSMKGQKLTSEEDGILNSVNSMYNVEKASEHQLVIPTFVKDGIWTRAAELHPVIEELLTTFIQGEVVIIKDTSPDSDGNWIDEAEESSDAKFTEGEIRLAGCELAKSVSISWKLNKMNDKDYETYLINRLGEKVGNAIAKSCFVGKGKPSEGDTFKAQARGTITALENEENTPRIVKYSKDTGIEYTNITTLMGKIKAVYKDTIYANSETVWNQLANILDKNGRPIFMPDVTSDKTVGRIFGVPVKEEDGMPDGDILIGSYGKAYAFNFNETMSVYREDHVKARKTDYMAYGIADGDVISTEGFALLRKNV